MFKKFLIDQSFVLKIRHSQVILDGCFGSNGSNSTCSSCRDDSSGGSDASVVVVAVRVGVGVAVVVAVGPLCFGLQRFRLK